MKIGLVTNCVYNPKPEFIRYTDEYKHQYCDKWGIDYLRTSRNIYPHLPPAWSKPTIMLGFIRNYDWLVWMDADASPVGMDFDLDGFLSSSMRKVVMIRDINDWNSGVFALPNEDRCIKWMEYIESLRNVPKYREGWWEQDAMIDSFKMDEWKDIVAIPPSGIGWNSYLPIYNRNDDPNIFHEGHWCLHVPGMDNDTRGRIFRNREWTGR